MTSRDDSRRATRTGTTREGEIDKNGPRPCVHARSPRSKQPLPISSDISKLVALWPWEREPAGRDGMMRLLARLRRAARDERRRGLAGHWSYDLARHAQLVSAYREALRRYLADEASCSGRAIHPPPRQAKRRCD